MKKPSDQTAAQQLGLLVMRNYAEQMRRPSSFFSKALAKEKPAPPSVLDNFWGRGPSDLAEGLLSLPHHLLHLQEERAFGEQIPKLAGATAMRGYLVAIFLSAIFLYYVLHCISWGTSVYWAHPVEMQPRKRSQPCREKPAFASLLRFHEFHPFLCASDFKKIASLYGGDKFSLPYGIKASEEPFRLALSALQSCDLFDEFDTIPSSQLTCHAVPCGLRANPRAARGRPGGGQWQEGWIIQSTPRLKDEETEVREVPGRLEFRGLQTSSALQLLLSHFNQQKKERKDSKIESLKLSII
ncbi:type 2 lactosamine alpha-2,3-sialyltransferase isoform X7 [Equus przewalskii]|uniref:Type 2 lactosamine alpha-2,3-sialyltransferase isoform X7 n=1 Tax=Equus przewalskii TaxID=9798 RepID=A0ABM4LCN9_EQUPR